MYNKKIWCLILSATVLFPASSIARGRDYAMAVSGAIIVGAGLTFVIKSGKTPSKERKTSSIELKAWNPMNTTSVLHDQIQR